MLLHLSLRNFKLIILDRNWKEKLVKDCAIFETMRDKQVAVLVGTFRRVRYRGGLCCNDQGSAPRRLRRTCVSLKKTKLSALLKYTAGGAHHRLLSLNAHIL